MTYLGERAGDEAGGRVGGTWRAGNAEAASWPLGPLANYCANAPSNPTREYQPTGHPPGPKKQNTATQ
jgi:hypothetical protein